jgi:hypothetical protein
MCDDVFNMFKDENGNPYTFWQIVKFTVITLVLFIMFVFVVNVGTIYENHVLCQRGATEYCER